MKRIEWVDIARGIGIILVILGHIGIGKVGKFIWLKVNSWGGKLSKFSAPIFLCIFKTNHKNI